MGHSDYQFDAGDRLRVFVEIETHKGEVTKFAIQLVGWIADGWQQLIRYDNFHESSPHRHTVYPDGHEETHTFVAALPQTFLGEALEDLKERAEWYLEEFERQSSNMGAVDYDDE